MNPSEIYSSKAKKYARYRWDYAPQAIEAILHIAQVTEQFWVADIGAGTGILTRHFVGRVKHLIALEPNDEMRRIAARELGQDKHCSIVNGRAEAIPFGDHRLDLITVAQSMHWFDPEPTRREFLRVLRPKGWLAIIKNYGVDQTLLGDCFKVVSSPTSLTAPLGNG